MDFPRMRWEPLSNEEIAEMRAQNFEQEPDYDDRFFTADGREFRFSYESLTIAETGSTDAPMHFSARQPAEQAWVDLQTLVGATSEMASDPDWDEFPEPQEPMIQ